MILSEAEDIRIGSEGVEAVYLGSQKIWPDDPMPGYTQIAWIRGTGTQYINTGYTPQSSSAKVEISAQILGGGDAKQLFSCLKVAAGVTWGYAGLYSLWIYSPTRTDTGITNIPSSADSPFLITVEVNPTTRSISARGNTSTGSGYDPSQGAESYLIFAEPASGGGAGYFIDAKVTYCKIYDNGVLVRDLVPVIRNSDSKPGLYDLVNATFYGNAGTGEFVVPT